MTGINSRLLRIKIDEQPIIQKYLKFHSVQNLAD